MWKWKHQHNASLGVRPVQQDQTRETRQKQRISWPDEFSVALLIDGDHNPFQPIGVFQSHAERLGPLAVQRVYGNWGSGRLGGWEKVLSSHRLEERHCGPVAPGKNAADIALVVDAMRLHSERGVRKFVLVASDSDYTPLVETLRVLGCIVVVIGKATTPLALQQAADAFRLIEYPVVPEQQVPVYTKSPGAKKGILPKAEVCPTAHIASGETMPLPIGSAPTQVKQWVLEQLVSSEATPYAWVQVPDFRDTLRSTFDFRPKAYGYKHLFALLEAFPDVFELHCSSGQAFIHEVRRVKR